DHSRHTLTERSIKALKRTGRRKARRRYRCRHDPANLRKLFHSSSSCSAELIRLSGFLFYISIRSVISWSRAVHQESSVRGLSGAKRENELLQSFSFHQISLQKMNWGHLL